MDIDKTDIIDSETDISIVEENQKLEKGDTNDSVRTIEEIIFNSDSAIYSIISICISLIILLAAGIGIIHYWNDSEIGIIGGPPSALLVWENEYRELTGVEMVNDLDGSGVILCIVDSGIDLDHPDFKDLELAGWFDAVNEQSQPYDDEGHGTAMAGIIVANGGFEGISPGVELLVAKAIGDDGVGSDEFVSDSVDWCVTEGADIISLSLGGNQGFGSGFFTTDSLEQSVENALDSGIFVIAAAGNDGLDDDGDVESPGSVEDVICVGGVNRNGNIWSGSSKGDNDGRFFSTNPILPRSNPDKKPELVAPGNEVPVLMATGIGNDAYWGWSSGTSAATAWVSGAIALFLENNTEFQSENTGDRSAIENLKMMIMQNSQMSEGQSGHDDYFGYGILRIDKLMNVA